VDAQVDLGILARELRGLGEPGAGHHDAAAGRRPVGQRLEGAQVRGVGKTDVVHVDYRHAVPLLEAEPFTEGLGHSNLLGGVESREDRPASV